MLTVPEPLPDDAEAVVTALETADIFGKQGDVKEAVRWVRRAAELAGDQGNDMRALTLARAVADLNISSSRAPTPPSTAAAAAPPPPPPLPGGSASPDDSDDAETRVVDSARLIDEYEKSRPAIPTNGAHAAAPATEAAPPPSFEEAPPVRKAPPAPSEKAAAELARSADDATPVSRRGIGSIAELLARKEAELPSSLARAAEQARTDTGGWEDPPPVPPEPVNSSVPPQPVAQPSAPPVERRTARPAGERILTPVIVSQPYTERPPLQVPNHQAVRASIVATAEPGVYVMRVLAAGQAPAPTAQEVFVVVADASLSPFGQR